MRVGILTFHSVDNFGAVLQAYALQEYLRSQGHEVEILDYRPSYFHIKRRMPARIDRILGHLVSKYQATKFERFRRDFLYRSQIMSSNIGDFSDSLKYDLLVVGSDQVWSPDVNGRTELDMAYFFDWIPDAYPIRKISYAASFGADKVADKYLPGIRKGLSRLDAISVREDTGVTLATEIAGRIADWVCDPVFLLTKSQWMSRLSCDIARRNIVMTYMPPEIGLMKELARKMNSKVTLCYWNPYYAVGRRLGVFITSPQEWVSLIATSKASVTMSFHCVAFSIIFHTPFVYLCKRGGHSTRVISLLTRLGLEEQILFNDEATADRIMMLLEHKINWERVGECLTEYRECSVRYLTREVCG